MGERSTKDQLYPIVRGHNWIVAFAGALLCIVASGEPASSQVQRSPLVLGERITIRSGVLEENRELLVHLPDNEPEDSQHPILLVLDAETHFTHVVGLVEFLSHPWVARIPPMIVVGVVNTDRLRDVTPTATDRYPGAGGVEPFLEFLETEVLPFLNTEFGAIGRPTLFGHSGSGLAVLFGLLRFGDSFRGYLAIDPSLDWDDGVTVDELEEFLLGQEDLNTFVTFGSYKPKADTGRLFSIFEQTPLPGLLFSAPIYEGASHNSMVHRAVEDGLIEMFSAPESQR